LGVLLERLAMISSYIPPGATHYAAMDAESKPPTWWNRIDKQELTSWIVVLTLLGMVIITCITGVPQ